MDGVTGLTQPAIEPGKTFVYEFVARRAGTFMYHPHADEKVQMATGMMGFWVTHPRAPSAAIAAVDRDYVFLLNAYDVTPGASVPRTSTMTDFNLWSWNSRIFPGIAPLVARQHERVRIRVGNLSMTNHPIHLHGHEMQVTGTDGGPTPPASRWPEVTVDIAVGQMRQLEFVAEAEGDWSLHCHKSHHTMNAMSHDVPNMIGVDQKDVVEKIRALVPGYMAMGGDGPYGSLEMGGMFSVVKVRRDQPAGDYRDPDWYRPPAGTTAWEWTGEPPPAASHAAHNPSNDVEVQAKKPDMGGMHMEH